VIWGEMRGLGKRDDDQRRVKQKKGGEVRGAEMIGSEKLDDDP
jgi:hypothetical protein